VCSSDLNNAIINGIVNNTIYFSETNAAEIDGIIKTLKNKKCNINTLPIKFFKFLSPILSILIASLFNLCFTRGIYPSSLKIARIVPVFKSGQKTDIKNYRPISILSTINKIFEKLIHARLTSFFERNDIPSQKQYGFCKGKSTTHATYEVLSKILPAFTDKKYCICVFADFSKAFVTSIWVSTLMTALNLILTFKM
jgi:hypothetical protein